MGSLGALSLALAMIGIYSVAAYSVHCRTREIGIRMALGARPAQVLSSVLRRTVVLCIAGILIGTIVTLAAGT